MATANLADPAAPAALLKDAEAQLGGGVDILVNNAGLTREWACIAHEGTRIGIPFSTSTSGPHSELSRAALKGMMSRRWGRIVSITSIVGVTGNGGQANYAASKVCLIGISGNRSRRKWRRVKSPITCV